MVQRGVIVARIKRGCEEQVASVFDESDGTDLPRLAGVRHRSLFVMEDLYVHLVEIEGDLARSVANVHDHPLFKEVSDKLKPFIEPYNPATWTRPADAMAREFYSWDADGRNPI